jgi:ABC-type cobalt transport system substrate-binding protein
MAFPFSFLLDGSFSLQGAGSDASGLVLLSSTGGGYENWFEPVND